MLKQIKQIGFVGMLLAGSAAAQTSGTLGKIPKYSTSAALIDSAIYESGGNVGIGTISPTFTLDVRGAATTIFNVQGDGAVMNLNSSGRLWQLVNWGSGNGGQLPGSFAILDGTASQFRQFFDPYGDIFLGANINVYGAVLNSNLLVSPTANIGINTVTPYAWSGVSAGDGSNVQIYGNAENGAARLIVNSPANSANADPEIHLVNGNSAVDHHNHRLEADTTGIFLDQPNDNYTQRTVNMFWGNDGKVGIGTYSPFGNFDVAGDTTSSIGTIYLRGNTSNSATSGFALNWANANATIASIQAVNPSPFFANLALGVYSPGTGAPVEAMRIITGGNVGIGTTTPAYKLDVNGYINTNSGFMINGTPVLTATPGGGGLAGTFAGVGAGGANTGTYNSGFGVNAEANTTAGTDNTAMGVNALVLNTVGSKNSAFGSGALLQSTGSYNTAVGFSSGGNLQTGNNNIIIGNNINLPASDSSNMLSLGNLIYATGLSSSGGSGVGTGNVGIGTATPTAQLEVAGYVKVTGGGIYFPSDAVNPQTVPWTGTVCGDFAESVDVTGGKTNYEPGDVMVIDPENTEKFLKSSAPYSTLVAGIYSTKPGVTGRHQTTDKPGPDEVPMAVVGIVPAKVSTENGPIKRGDLLVTSSTLGYAMKGTDRIQMVGAIVGKALGPLDSGTGVIEVLVSLQ